MSTEPALDREPIDGRRCDVIALLQAGAVLVNVRGERCIRRFDPDRLERAPTALLAAAAGPRSAPVAAAAAGP